MKFRQISIILALLILGASIYFTLTMLSAGDKAEEKEKRESAKAVKVKTVKLDSISATIPISGELEAKKRINIFAEVQGKFIRNNKPFKAGIEYNKGEVLMQIDDQEARLNLQAQKSDLMNSIAQMLPDLKLDYPAHYKRWQNYLDKMKVKEPLPELPPVKKDQVKYFVTSQKIYNQFYSIQSQAERLSKHTIRAPFDGVLTESMIDPGTLVRPGQQLGEFINTNSFEMAADISASDLNMVSINDSVILNAEDINLQHEGRVVRINDRVNPGIQSGEVFIQTNHPEYKEGMYFEGKIFTGYIDSAFRVPRKFLKEGEQIWIVKNDQLKKKAVQVVHKTKDIAIVKSLTQGTKVLFESLPSAYGGMPVKPFKAQNP